jgi:uncharacterized repeat protein (TIGR01451 family)
MNQSLLSVHRLLRSLLLGAVIAGGLLQPFSPAHASSGAGASLVAQPDAVVLPGSGDHFYKVAVSQTGMHAITYTALATAGLPVTTLDPATFQIFEQGTEIVRRVVDTDISGTFNAGDYILFYGRAVNTLYTGTNIYWLTYGTSAGLDMTDRNAAPQTGLPAVTSFSETVHLEQDLTYRRALPLTGQADRWYWYQYMTRCTINQPGKFIVAVNTPGVASGTHTASLTPLLRGFTTGTHRANFDLNGTLIGQATFMNTDQYVGTFSFNQNLLLESSNTLTLTAPCLTTSTLDWGLVNWYDLRYDRTYAAPTTGQFAFAVDAAQPVSVTLTGVISSTAAIYDISAPRHPQALSGVQTTASVAALSAVSAYNLAFTHTPAAPARYIAAAPGQFLAPDSITLDAPSSLRNPAQGADWIVISHRDFLSQAQRLATHRRDYQEFRTAVIDVQDVYDEFGGGLKDQEAIRAFIRFAYESWPRPAPRYVVLLGDGHYDPRDRLGTHVPDFIPPYLAPVNPFDGIVGADNRYVSYDPVLPVENPMPFMSLGRLPARSLAEATAIVDKIIAYETTPPHATWNREVIFVADNADSGGDFPEHSNSVADSTYYLPAEYNRQKIYYQVNYATGTDANNAIVNGINQGALFVNYHGHASVQNWAQEPQLLTLGDQARLTNAGRYPIFLPMTCLEGDFIDPSPDIQSFGESIVRLNNAGGVASWSPTGKGVAKGHQTMWDALYEAIFQQGITEIGPATDYAKLALYDSTSAFKDLLDSYILFGDPATALDLPSPDVWVQKQAAPAAPWHASQLVTYTLTYGNAGVMLASGVRLTDTLPAELTGAAWTASGVVTPALSAIFAWELPDLTPGSTGVITITATVDPNILTGTAITNTASIAFAGQERPVSWPNNTSQAIRTVEPSLFSLGGHAYIDVNSSGQYDPGSDTPLANVPIEVRDSMSTLVATALTDGQGQWWVALPPGIYTVTAPMSMSGLALSTPQAVTVTLAAGSSPAVNFGYAAPTGLEIENARAVWIKNGARVDWTTRTESIVVEFNIYRSSDPSMYGRKLNLNPILPEAPPGEGASYVYIDADIAPGTTAYYWLEVVTDGGNIWIGPLVPKWTAYLPIILSRAR